MCLSLNNYNTVVNCSQGLCELTSLLLVFFLEVDGTFRFGDLSARFLSTKLFDEQTNSLMRILALELARLMRCLRNRCSVEYLGHSEMGRALLNVEHKKYIMAHSALSLCLFPVSPLSLLILTQMFWKAPHLRSEFPLHASHQLLGEQAQ